MLQIKIGTDPEVFLEDANGKSYSGHDLIPGTKLEPYPVMNGAIQVDGVALEFNTDPAETAEEFIFNIESVLSQMTAEFKKNAPFLNIKITPTTFFDQDYFDALPMTPKELGCTPDYNAYTGEQNIPPHTDEPFRTGSGHLHVGFADYVPLDKEHFEDCREVVKQLDTILYPSSLLWDADSKRRELYGKIGAFRPKSFGVEYRPMSNAWLRSPIMMRFVFDAASFCTRLLKEQNVKLFNDSRAEEIIAMIQADIQPDRKYIQDYLRSMNDTYGTPLFLGL